MTLGRDIEIYDYSTGTYSDVEVQSINRYGRTVEIEVFDYKFWRTQNIRNGGLAMKRMIIALLSLSLILPVYAKGSRSSGKSYSSKSSGRSAKSSGHVNPRSTQVRSYTKKDGTRVQAHRRTTQNSTKRDNYSTRGNVNPHTGKAGTKSAYK